MNFYSLNSSTIKDCIIATNHILHLLRQKQDQLGRDIYVCVSYIYTLIIILHFIHTDYTQTIYADFKELIKPTRFSCI